MKANSDFSKSSLERRPDLKEKTHQEEQILFVPHLCLKQRVPVQLCEEEGKGHNQRSVKLDSTLLVSVTVNQVHQENGTGRTKSEVVRP